MILCPHEIVAVHMAGGYALATGRGQAVLVHVDAGTANACMSIQNLFRYRLPVMLFAGRAPYTLHGELTGSRDAYVHFVQDPFDIASIVRPYVKWEYSLPSGVVVKEALARATRLHAERSARPGLHDAAARNAGGAMGRCRHAGLSAGAIRQRAVRRHRAGAGRSDRRSIDGGGKSDRADGLSRPQAAGGPGAGTVGANLRHPGRRIQFDRPQHLAGLAVFRRHRSAAPARDRRSRPAAGFGCAVRSAIRQARRRDQMDPDRHRSPEVGFPDVGISDRHAGSGRLRDRVAAGARRRRSARRRCLSPPRRRAHRKLERRARRRRQAPRRRQRQQGRLRRAQPGLRVRNAQRQAVAGRHRRQRGDPQRADPAGAYHAQPGRGAMSGSPAAGLAFPAAWRWG